MTASRYSVPETRAAGDDFHDDASVVVTGDRDQDDVAHYRRLVIRGLPGAALGALVGVTLAVAFMLVFPPQYTATATVKVNPVTSTPFDPTRSAAGLIDPATESAVATSHEVAELAVSRFGPVGADPATLRRSLEVQAVQDSTIMEISSSAADVDEARARADAVAEAYLEYRTSEAQERRAGIVDELQRTMRAVSVQRSAAQALVNAARPDSGRRLRALAQVRLADVQLDNLQARQNELAGVDISGGKVLDSAASSPAMVTPSLRGTLASGAFGGALVGFLVSLLLHSRRGRTRRLRDLKEIGPITAAVTMGVARRRNHRLASENIEGLRVLRQRLSRCGRASEALDMVALFDARGNPELLSVPLTVTRVLGQPQHGGVLVVLGLHLDEIPTWSGRLELQTGPDGRLRSGAATTVPVFVCPVSDSDAEDDPWYTAAARDHVRRARNAERTVVVWCARRPSEATRLALLSESTSLVLVAQERRSRLKVLRGWVEEAVDSGVNCIGAVLAVPAHRRGRGR